MTNTREHDSVSIPVLYRADVAIAGASTGAVAAALAVRDAGQQAFVVSDRPYLGEETAGALNLWQEPGEEDPLLHSLFPQGSKETATPLAIKHTLENALLDAEIPFLYLSRPVALLRDENDGIAGLLVAYRTSLYAVLAGTIIDATTYGIVARMAAVKTQTGRAAPGNTALTILAKSLPDAWKDIGVEVGTPITLPGQNGDDIVHAFTFTLSAEDKDSSISALAAREHRYRSRFTDRAFLYSADSIPHTCEETVSADLKDSFDALADDAFRAAPGVHILNALLPLAAKPTASLGTAEGQVTLGRRVGSLAAAEAEKKPVGTPVRAEGGKPECSGPFGFAPSFVRENGDLLEMDLPAFPHLGDFDVAIAGGGTAGAPAGISAARSGARTVVLEMQHALGGVGTLGLIASYYFGNKVGFTAEIDRELETLDPERTGAKAKRWSPELKASWYARALADAGGEAWFGSFAFGVKTENGRVSGLLVSTPFGAGYIGCGCVVDASGNADLAAAAGAPCRTIDARHVAVQGTGLSPRKPTADYRNSDHNFIDDNDPVGVTHAFANARAKFAEEFDVSPIIDSRERRQIIGEIELSPLDFLAERTFPDTITTAMSNFDTHGFTVHPVFMVMPPDKKPLFAHVPFRCLLPRGVDGLMVTGLGMSAHRDAIPVIRMQADVQNQGYAAGLAAAMSAAGRTPLLELDVRSLQRNLQEKDILDPEVLTHGDSFPLPSNAIKDAADHGPTDLFHTAVLFAHPKESAPLLLEKIGTSSDPREQEGAALVLGMLGFPEGAEVLARAVSSRQWDEGWNYRGMGQFGMSMSYVDALIIALGRTGSSLAVEPIAEKITALDSDACFSHCRAVAVAAACVPHARLAEALHELLRRPGMQGHAHVDSKQVIRTVNHEINETEARNLSLRELHLARGLFLTGDHDGLGQRILERYTRDLRGHYARHAEAILSEKDIDSLRRETA